MSHAVETLLSRIAQSRDRATPAALDLVQRGLDDLQQMRDAIDAGRTPSAAPGLIGQLEGFDARPRRSGGGSAGRRTRLRRSREPAARPRARRRRGPACRAPVRPPVEPVATVDLTDADFAQAR